MNLKREHLTRIGVFLFALLVALLLIHHEGGFDRSVGKGDALQYVSVARSVAEGHGFVYATSPWGPVPHLGRLPLWPILATPAALLMPHASNGMILRSTSAIVQALTAALLALVAFRLFRDYRIAALTGVFYAVYPPALALMDTGFSEGSFILATAAGLLFLMRSGWQQLLGAFLLGCAVLSRSNVLILPFFMLGIALLYDRSLVKFWKRALILICLFLLPPAVWVLRNYAVSGVFPLLTSVEGETLYGGNNPVAANDLQQWGYWVFPDDIPGETARMVLARRMNEAQLNAYYHQKAIAFIRANIWGYPRLLLGKLIRGFVPVPWTESKASLLVFSLRFVLYVLALWALLARRLLREPWFLCFLGAMFLSTLATTIIYYGTARFTFCLEPYLLIPVAALMVGFLPARSRPIAS